MTNVFEYKGYCTRIHYSAEDNVLYGKIEGIVDLVDFESSSVEEIETEFHKAVDEYLAYCESIGKTPDKEFRGTFNVRIEPQVHRELYMLSVKYGVSLNHLIQTACANLCESIQRGETIQLTFHQAVQYGIASSTLTSQQPYTTAPINVSTTLNYLQ